MTGWIILGVIIVLIAALCLLRMGVYLKYDETLVLRVLIGPFSVTLLPRKIEADGEKQPEKAPAEKKEKKASFQKPNAAQMFYSLETLPGILKKALGRFGRGITVSPLFVKVVFAGDDPADTAENYGKAQALVSALYPEIKKLIRIRKTKIALSADYQREQMELQAELGVRLRVGTILFIAFSAGFGLLRWFLGYRKLAKKENSADKTETDKKENKRHQAEAA